LEWKRMLKAAERGEIADPAEVWPNRPYPPYPDLYGTTFLWLMFCSHCYFPKTILTTNLPLSFFIGGTADIPLSRRVEFRRHPQDPYLITELKAYDPGYVVTPEGKRYDRSPPFNKPWIAFRYSALEFSRLKRIYVPKKFVCEWYAPEIVKSTNSVSSKKSSRLTKTRWFEGETEKVEPLRRSITGRPPLDGFFAVTDHRAEKMTGGKPIEYLVKNGEWWQTNETRFLKAIKRPGIIILPGELSETRKYYRVVFLAVLFFSALLYIYFAWYKSKQIIKKGGYHEK
ncbi:MAG: hypothetical protein J7M06_05040, partial [Proteobacteria bacterium]|nr:hypothetical protein [Pseudomonadota bacterium]